MHCRRILDLIFNGSHLNMLSVLEQPLTHIDVAICVHNRRYSFERDESYCGGEQNGRQATDVTMGDPHSDSTLSARGTEHPVYGMQCMLLLHSNARKRVGIIDTSCAPCAVSSGVCHCAPCELVR